MSIHATIVGIAYKQIGSWTEPRLTLESTTDHDQPDRLIVVNPPNGQIALEVMLDCDVWSGGSRVCMDDDQFAERVGVQEIRLLDGWWRIADQWHKEHQAK